MILYASRWRSKVHQVLGWRIFKLEYECEDSARQLFDYFWDYIIINISTYAIVREYDWLCLVDRLKSIPNPRDNNRPTDAAPDKITVSTTVCNFAFRLRRKRIIFFTPVQHPPNGMLRFLWFNFVFFFF